ncbi:MAG: hypothetical protein FJX80_10255, partial [Bacteroidetes bacterium]|nr:hypothetical protein [Bacteroidota bacterium]
MIFLTLHLNHKLLSMKALLFLSSFLLIGITFSQSKKEQIEQLNYRVDSLKSIISAERDTNSQKISSFENTIRQLNQKIIGFEAQISSLNTNVSKLSSDLQSSKAETASKQQEVSAKQQEISNLQAQLQTKKDSLDLLRAELEKLKPAPKPVVTNNTNNTSTNQVTQTGSFKSVKIGAQTWMAENLNVSTFRNGDPIPEAKTNEEWEKAGKEGKPAWCYYENDSKNGAKYGKLYNWYAVNDSRGLAPTGWHIPSDAEWTTLENQLGDDAGKKMKSTSGWKSWEEDITCSSCKNWNAEYRRKTACHVCKDTRVSGIKTISGNGTNSSGFSGLPGGYRNYSGYFYDMGFNGFWWSST